MLKCENCKEEESFQTFIYGGAVSGKGVGLHYRKAGEDYVFDIFSAMDYF